MKSPHTPHPAEALTGRRVTFSQPGTGCYATGTVRGPDALLPDFVNVLWMPGDGRPVMVATVHASRCEVLS